MFSFAAAIRALCGRCPTLLAPKSARADRRLKRAAGATVEAMEQRLLLSAVPPGVQFSADAVYSDSGNPGAYIFDLSGGTATFDTDISKASPDWQNATIALGDGTKAVFNSPQTLLGLQLAGSAKLTASTGGGGANGNFIDIGLGGLSMSTTATIDLADNDMILQNAGSAGVAQMQSLVSSAFNGGNWLGAGVGSSDAASSVGPSMPMGIGYAENCAPNLATPFTTFDGVVVTSTTVFAKYTLASDANLDGRINNKDYAALERYYN